MLSVRFKKTHPLAVAPSKAHATDSGYDLVLVEKLKEVNNVTFFDTGIQVAPPPGFYFDLVGRSSISKSGYMLANNIGIIDNSYRGNIMVALVKINPDAPDLVLPARLVQIIPRRVWDLPLLDVGDDDLSETARGTGGFGSSGSYTHERSQ
jgi:dUTP pyrophosphatase